MKRKILLTVAIILLSVQAGAFTIVNSLGQAVNYMIVTPTTVKVYDCYPITGDLVIPSTVTYSGTTYSVIGIDDRAFEDNGPNLTSVTIPNSVTSIGACAFRECTGLVSITIGNSVTSIDANAFYGCNALTDVYYTGTLSQWCGIDFTGKYGNPCFITHSLNINGTPLAGNLVLPSDVTQIKKHVFAGLNGLTSVEIHNSVMAFGERVFDGCTGLTSVSYTGDLSQWCGIDFMGEYSNPCQVAHNLSLNGTPLVGGLVVPSGITQIKSYTFAGCTGLTSVTISPSVTSIGEQAFFGCDGLTSVSYTGDLSQWCGIDFMGDYSNPCFITHSLNINGTPLAGDLVIPSGITQIKKYLFAGCTGLTSVTIPNLVTMIGDHAFENCTGLTAVSISNTVTLIGSFAFSGCTELDSVAMGNSVKYIGDGAFRDCTSLTSTTLSDAVTFIGYYAFQNCTGLTSISLPDHVSVIGSYAFENCTELTSFTIPDSVSYIGDHIFAGCTGLANVTIGSSVNAIGAYAFENCTSLASITIPELVATIGEHAFWNCSGLTKINWNAANCEGGVVYQSDTFSGTSWYPTEWNFLFSGCTNLTKVVFGDSVQEIPTQLLCFCNSLTSVTIGKSVTTIGSSAFLNCINLETVNFTGTLSQWCGITFEDFTSNPCYYAQSLNINGTPLTNLVIPSDITQVKNYTFYGLVNMNSVTIHSSVTSIGSNAFAACFGLYSLTVKCAEPPTLADGDVFAAVGCDINVVVPCESVAAYQSDQYWSYFTNISGQMVYDIVCLPNHNWLGSTEILTMPTCENNSRAAIKATPVTLARFIQWSDGVKLNPRQIVVTQDTTVVAIFESRTGINEQGLPESIYVYNNSESVTVCGADGLKVQLFDTLGRMIFSTDKAGNTLRISIPARAVYIVKIGEYKAKKVTVL